MRIFSFVKKDFFLGLTVISNITGALKYISIKNQQCKVRPKIVDVSSNNLIYNSVKVNRCSGSCNNINNPYARISVPHIVKNFNVKVFNLMPLTNETRSIKWHETIKCICRLNKIICNNKKLINKEVCDKGLIWNPRNCGCGCAKACTTSQYLDYSDCKYKKKIIDPLIEECTENDDETKIVNKTITKNGDETKLVNKTITKNENSYCNSCKVYIVLMIVAIVVSTGVTIYFVYYNHFLIKNNISCTKSNAGKQTII